MNRLLVKITLIALMVGYVCPRELRAQLNWGADGTGGTGTWNLTNANWWNGTSAVAWASGSDAIFSGTGGAVTSVFPGPTASSLTFNASGYSITGGWINTSSVTGLTITTNSDATIGSLLNSNGGSALSQLNKNGAGALTMTGTNFLNAVKVNQGEYRLSGSGDLFFSNVVLADAAGVIVTLGQTSNSVSAQGLSGGGNNGGIIRPNSQARTVTLTLFQTTSAPTFYGVLADNGSGVLALTAFGTTTQSQILAGANTYTGITSVTGGTLIFSGGGSALNSSAISVSSGATLRLDNSGTVLSDRLADSAPVTLIGGSLQFKGNGSTASSETLGLLNIQRVAGIDVSQPSSAITTLNFSGLNRIGSGTLNITGTGGVTISGVANTNGIAPAYIVAGNEWATVGSGGVISALSSYATSINTALTTDNVLVTAAGFTVSLSGSTVWNSLNVKTTGGTVSSLDLGSGNMLTLNSGGLLSSGTSALNVQNGTLQAGGTGELIITNRNTLTVSAVITDGSVSSGLTKSGAGTLVLEGANTYTGNTVINEGVLSAGGDGNLGQGANVLINGGTVQITSSFSSNKAFGSTSGASGTIDTNGNHLTLSTSSFGSLTKTGAGTLTLTSGSSGVLGVSQGSLELTGGTYGSVNINSGGTLIAGTTMESLLYSGGGRLDIGGTGAATLITTGMVNSFASSATSANPFKITFGLGSGQSDLWQSNSFFFVSGSSVIDSIQFDFTDLGGLQTGHSYTLIQFLGGTSASASYFGLTSDMINSGWAGNFSLTGGALKVTLTTIPEPTSLAYAMGVGALLFAAWSIRLRTVGSQKK